MSQEKIIGSTDLLCRTCRFANKCHIVKMINQHIEDAEDEAFKLMKVDLNLVPVITYCPEYQKHPEIIRRELAGEVMDEDEE